MIKPFQTFQGTLLKRENNGVKAEKKSYNFNYQVLKEYEKEQYQVIDGLNFNKGSFMIKVYEPVDFKIGDYVILFGENSQKKIVSIGFNLTSHHNLGQKYKNTEYLMNNTPRTLVLE